MNAVLLLGLIYLALHAVTRVGGAPAARLRHHEWRTLPFRWANDSGMAGASTTQVAPAQEAGRPQPQTTVEPPGGPFVRHTQPGRRAQYANTGQAFGGLITTPLVAAPGYLRSLRIRVAATGGTGGSAVAAADAPWNTIALLTLRDAFGTPLIVGPGFEMLRLLPKYSGQFGLGAQSDPLNLPSFSAPSANGNYVFQSIIPLEFTKAYGVVSMANASLLPTLQMQLSAQATVLSTPPATLQPVLEVDLDSDFYWLPEGVSIEPPGLGTTCQWVFQNANPTIGSSSNAIVSLPRLGGYLTCLILILRDSTGARIDAFPARMRVYVDGVPLIDTRDDTLNDDMQIQFGWGTTAQWARDTGVKAFTRKTSLAQVPLGLLDTGEMFLSTNPGTLIQIEGSPWGVISNAPATLSAIIGQVVPAGSLIQGLPEL